MIQRDYSDTKSFLQGIAAACELNISFSTVTTLNEYGIAQHYLFLGVQPPEGVPVPLPDAPVAAPELPTVADLEQQATSDGDGRELISLRICYPLRHISRSHNKHNPDICDFQYPNGIICGRHKDLHPELEAKNRFIAVDPSGGIGSEGEM